MKIKDGILIIGTIPPPIGGVTIHVKRLLERLKENSIDFSFYDLKKFSLRSLLRMANEKKIIHLHTSNVYFRFLISFYGLILGKKTIITYHGNLNRYGLVRNFLDRLSIRLCYVPLVLNSDSFKIAYKLNKRSELTSAFIPPQSIEVLPETIVKSISRMRLRYKEIFCTNASNVSYDKNDKEIYQITELIKLFSAYNEKSLIISDPSGNYKKLIQGIGGDVPDNILFISIPHDFNAVLQLSDCMIRFTRTDGDSLSIKEALMIGIQVIATDIVTRPPGVILIENTVEELHKAIYSLNLNHKSKFREDASVDLIHLYSKLR